MDSLSADSSRSRQRHDDARQVRIKNARVDRLARLRLDPIRGTLVGAAATLVIAAAFLPLRGEGTRAAPALVLVLPVVLAGVSGGAIAAAVTAIFGTAVFNVAFIPPYWTPKVDALDDGVALAVFLVIAATVGTLVARESERRRAAEHRAAEVETLYARLEEATAEQQRLAEEADRLQVLEQIDSQRAALLRSVSHDLRTPLATIRAVATDLRSGAPHDEETRAELLETVADEAERLDRLVANLLSMSRIEAGALHPERQAVDVEELVLDRVRRLAPLFRQIRVQVEIPPDLPLVDADYTMLDQVVTNLLENAARHAPPTSTVRIDARALTGAVELEVSDEGIGVPEFERERIFEPFHHGEGSRSSGLGLAICRAVAEAHGGTIRVDRTPGGGATFIVRMPARLERLPRE